MIINTPDINSTATHSTSSAMVFSHGMQALQSKINTYYYKNHYTELNDNKCIQHMYGLLAYMKHIPIGLHELSKKDGIISNRSNMDSV